MMFEFAHATDPGKVRANNEDAVATDALHNVAVLADGMGGYNAGEIASAMAVSFVRTELTHWLQTQNTRSTLTDAKRAVEACISNANIAIFNAAQANPQFSGMGTTLVVAMFNAGRVVIGHVGDSRCYLWRSGVLTSLTKDHSLLQEQIDAGLLTQAQAKLATHKNLVTRALGVELAVKVDVRDHQPMADDVYLMCSDGLNDMLSDLELGLILNNAGTLSEKTQALIQQANAAGGRDNISVILVQAKAKSGHPRFLSRFFRSAP